MTTLTQPIAKLYKRCARRKHDTCPGHFDYTSGQTYSVCSCDCHAGVSDERPAPRMKMPACCTRCGKPFTGPAKRYECQCNAVTCEDKAEAVAEAIAIVATPKRKPAPVKYNEAGLPPVKGPKNPAGGAKVVTGARYKPYNNPDMWKVWPDAAHTFIPTDNSIFTRAPFSADMQAQLDTMARKKER